MALVVDGNGSITGLSVGGLPDLSITAADIAAGTITADKLSQLVSNGYCDIGTIRIQWGYVTTSGTALVTSGYFANYYADASWTYPAAFKTGYVYVNTTLSTDYHDAFVAGHLSVSSTNTTTRVTCGRAAGVQSRVVHFIAIGEKP